MSKDESPRELLENLPAMTAPVKAGALKAFSQLLGGLGTYIGAWVRRPTQAVEDKTDARSLITKRIAEVAAERAISDPEIIGRALEKWLPSELRKQENKEAIVSFALEGFVEAGADETGPSQSQQEIDDEWLNSFERFAEDASSERMQRLWAKVLNGEIMRPGSFGRSTLRFLHEMDKYTAQAFEEVACHVIGSQVFAPDDDQVLFNRLLHLDSAGAVSGVGGLVSWQITSDENGIFSIPGAKFGLVGLTTPNTEVTLPAPPLTRSGRELIKIVPNPDEEKTILSISEMLKKTTGFPQNNVKGTALAEMIVVAGQSKLRKVRDIWGDSPFSSITANGGS